MRISGLVKSSLVDFPGLVACVLFAPGCNYNCFYCHNRSLLDGSSALLDPGCIWNFLAKRSEVLDGVVISGGEPTLQPGLIPFMEKVKSLGFRLKLDTNGSSPNIVAQLLQSGLCDYYAVDYKAPAERYQEICGNAANEKSVLKTIELLLENHANFEVRTTVFPQLTEHDLICMAKSLPSVPRYVLNRYRKPEKYLSCDQARISQKPYSQSQLNALSNAIHHYQPHVTE